MDELMEKLNGFLDAAASVVQEYAPQAVDAALFAVRIDAIYSLVLSVVLFAAFMFLIIGMLRTNGPITDDCGNPNKAGIFLIAKGFASCVILMAGGVSGALFGVFSIYNWIAAFDPMLGLVYKAAQSAGLL